MAIAVPDELQKSGGLGTNRALTALCGRSVSGRRASCKPSRELMCPRARGMAIAVPDELQESVGPGTNRALRAVRAVCGRSVAGR